MVALQAYIDDSYTVDGVFVLGGYIATAAAWAEFSKDWQQLLTTHGVLKKRDRRYHFKMTEMALEAERFARVQAFYRVIEKHALAAISCSINARDLARAKQRLIIPGVKVGWGFLDNLYLFTFRCLLDMFHTHLDRAADLLRAEDKVDFYFDNQAENGTVLSAWDNYIRERPKSIRDRYGATPRFEDDMDFLPLQAADLWAWWVRRWCTEGDVATKMEQCDFGGWQANRKQFPKIHITAGEEEIVTAIKEMARQLIGPNKFIHDQRVSFSGME